MNTNETPTEPVTYFQWWHRGKTPKGETISLRGYVIATTAAEALREVDKMLRDKFAVVRWMHGRKVEDSFVSYGPTVQKMRRQPRQLRPYTGPQVQTQTIAHTTKS